MLDNYFTTVLHKRIDTSSVDVNAIGMCTIHLQYDVSSMSISDYITCILSLTDIFHWPLLVFKAKSNDPEEILNLLELVVGVAVMCEDKNVFIPKIFELNDHSQVRTYLFFVFILQPSAILLLPIRSAA